jgi:SOS-response transcriptional repressor LexA
MTEHSNARRPSAKLREQIEWERDQLVSLLGLFEERRAASPLWQDDAFVEWRAQELLERGAGDDCWPREKVERVARRIQARAAAARLPVRRVDHAPEERPAPVLGLLTDVIDRAAASGCTPYLDLAAAAGAGRELWDAECESWIELPPDVPHGRYVALTISGESMAPLMHPGDVVLVKLGPRIASDTIIVARRPNEGYVVKRVGKIRRTSVELLSLNPDFPPLLIPRREHLIVGTVLLRWCAHGGGKREA